MAFTADPTPEARMKLEEMTIARAWEQYRVEFLTEASQSTLFIAEHCFYAGFFSSHVMRYEIHSEFADLREKIRITEALEAEARAFFAEHERRAVALFDNRN